MEAVQPTTRWRCTPHCTTRPRGRHSFGLRSVEMKETAAECDLGVNWAGRSAFRHGRRKGTTAYKPL